MSCIRFLLLPHLRVYAAYSMQLCPQQRFSAHAARAAGLMSWKCWEATDWWRHCSIKATLAATTKGSVWWPQMACNLQHRIRPSSWYWMSKPGNNDFVEVLKRLGASQVHGWATVSLHGISKPKNSKPIYACRHKLCRRSLRSWWVTTLVTTISSSLTQRWSLSLHLGTSNPVQPQ